jgi:hypothetical protein
MSPSEARYRAIHSDEFIQVDIAYNAKHQFFTALLAPTTLAVGIRIIEVAGRVVDVADTLDARAGPVVSFS